MASIMKKTVKGNVYLYVTVNKQHYIGSEEDWNIKELARLKKDLIGVTSDEDIIKILKKYTRA